MSNLPEPDAAQPAVPPAPGTSGPAASASPYGPGPAAPPPNPYAPVVAVRRTGTPSIVWGIVLLFLSLFAVPRTLGQLIVAIIEPDELSFADELGGFVFTAAMATAGVLLVINGARIKRRRSAAV